MRITSKLATVVLTSGLAISGLAAMAGPASAADGGGTTANVGVTSGITMTGLTPSFTLTGAPGATVTGVGAVTFKVETNNPTGYTVNVLSAAATMVPPLPLTNTDSIPIAALTVRATGGSTYTPMSAATPVQVHSQGGRSLDGGDALSNDYQIRIPVVAVDTYSATLNYVAIANG